MFRSLLHFRKHFFGQTTRCTLCLRPTEQGVIPPEQLVQGHYVCPTCQQALSPKEITESLQALGLLPPLPITPSFSFNKITLASGELILWTFPEGHPDVLAQEVARIHDTTYFELYVKSRDDNMDITAQFTLVLQLRALTGGSIDILTTATLKDSNYYFVMDEKIERMGQNTIKMIYIDLNVVISHNELATRSIALRPIKFTRTFSDLLFDGHKLSIDSVDYPVPIDRVVFMDRYGYNDWSNTTRFTVHPSIHTSLIISIAPVIGIIHIITEELPNQIITTAIVAYNEYLQIGSL